MYYYYYQKTIVKYLVDKLKTLSTKNIKFNTTLKC